jgi:hypothetical protein
VDLRSQRGRAVVDRCADCLHLGASGCESGLRFDEKVGKRENIVRLGVLRARAGDTDKPVVGLAVVL